MSQKLTMYIIKTTILDEPGFTRMSTSLRLNFPFCRLVQRVNEDLTIKIELDGWGPHMDEYFENYRKNKIIGTWTMEAKS